MQKATIKRGQKTAHIKQNRVDEYYYVTIVMESDISEYGDVLYSQKPFKTPSRAMKFIDEVMPAAK